MCISYWPSNDLVNTVSMQLFWIWAAGNERAASINRHIHTKKYVELVSGKLECGASMTAQWEKAFAANPDDLSLVSRTHMVESVLTVTLQLPSDLHMSTCMPWHIHTHTCMHTHTESRDTHK